jgi:glucose/arabinose dehydrogenase
MRYTSAILVALAFVITAQSQGSLTFKGTPQAASELHSYHLQVKDLPLPHATRSSSNGPDITEPPTNAHLNLPLGFEISVFAEGFENPRWLTLAPNGDIFVSDSAAGKIILLRQDPHTGKLARRVTFADGLSLPFGMAFHDSYFYVAETDKVVRYKYQVGETRAEGSPEEVISLPGHGYNQHWTRDIAFSRNGTKLFVTVGSQSNDSPNEDERRAAINEYNPDGSGHRIYASGLRNPVGIAFYPGSNTLYATVNERDGLGENLPPDYFTSVREGGFYGWPYAYIGPHPDPRNARGHKDLVQETLTPDVLIQAHSAALGLAFYQGEMFPAEYCGDAFVALHGSWNRAQRTGYKIIRIRFEDGKPTGEYDDFITGWSPNPDSSEVWGRPVGLLVLKDGSLLIADDGGKRIWRVTYSK